VLAHLRYHFKIINQVTIGAPYNHL